MTLNALNERGGGAAAYHRFRALLVICMLITVTGIWVNFRFTSIIVFTLILFGVAGHSLDTKKLILMYLLLDPFLCNVDPFRLGPIPTMSFGRLLAVVALYCMYTDRHAWSGKLIVNRLDRRNLLRIVVAAFSILFSSFMKSTPLRVLIDSLVIPFSFYLMAKRYCDDEDFIHDIYHVCILNIIILGTVGIMEMVTRTDLFRSEDAKFSGGRINGSFAMAEEFGMVMSILVIFVSNMGGSISDTRRWVRLRTISVVLGVFAVINTLTRGIWIALVAGLMSQLLLNVRKSFPVIVLLILLTIIVLPFLSFLVDIQSTIFADRIKEQGTIYARLATFASAFRMFRDRPILGVGYASYSEAYELNYYKYRSFYKNEISVKQPHNAFTGTLAETGVVGFFVFTVVFATILMTAGKVRVYSRSPLQIACASAIICITVAVLVDGFGHDFIRNAGYLNKLLFLLIGIISGFSDRVLTVKSAAQGIIMVGRHRE